MPLAKLPLLCLGRCRSTLTPLALGAVNTIKVVIVVMEVAVDMDVRVGEVRVHMSMRPTVRSTVEASRLCIVAVMVRQSSPGARTEDVVRLERHVPPRRLVPSRVVIRRLVPFRIVLLMMLLLLLLLLLR